MKHIKGADKLHRKMRRIPREFEDEIVKWANKSATELMGFQKALAPVETGDLVDTFHIEQSREPRIGVRVIAGDDPVFYEQWQEFGTSQGLPALNFFFGPYRLLRRRLRGRVKRAVNKAAKEVASRG